jgi:metal-responsive CopG/Arc/MetJ family transcriptional regulator
MEYIKTAISIQKSLFDQAERLARQMNVPRSRVFVLALEEYIQREQNRELLTQINSAYADEPAPAERSVREKSLKVYRESIEDEW